MFASHLRVSVTCLAVVGLTVICMALVPSASFAQSGRRGASRAGFQANSTNFVVYAADARLARKVAEEAERYRKELSVLWLGYEIEQWPQRCPIRVEVEMHAGGETSFAFVSDGSRKAVPTDWQMKIFGPPDRLLDAVLPHEVTHTIFATHFGRPLPRWADEGACTTVEHQSERNKNHRMLIDFLSASPSRGIPFNRMFTMRQYPHDILPLYAQGYSLAKFLIMQKGRQEFVTYLSDGMDQQRSEMDAQAWDVATRQHYGFRDLSELQLAWIAWVKEGSVERPLSAATLASADLDVDRDDRVAPADYQQPLDPAGQSNEAQSGSSRDDQLASTFPASDRLASANVDGGWYARQMREGARGRVSTNRRSLSATDQKSEQEQQKPKYLEDSRVESPTLWR